MIQFSMEKLRRESVKWIRVRIISYMPRNTVIRLGGYEGGLRDEEVKGADGLVDPAHVWCSFS